MYIIIYIRIYVCTYIYPVQSYYPVYDLLSREKERANARKSERARIEEDLQRIRSEADTLQSKVVSHQESRGQLEHSLEENRRKKERCR